MRTRALGALPYLMLACAVAGLGMMQSYMTTPGAVGDTPAIWPDDSGLERSAGRWTLVLAVHPKCPCTDASVAELEGVLKAAPIAPELVAVVRVPDEPGRTTGWLDSPLITALRRVAEVGADRLRLIEDPTGEIAASFGARTSGHAVLFDPGGAVRFSGGVTASRGMRGPSTGAASIASLLGGREARASRAAVYGCPLCDAPGPGIDDRRGPPSPDKPARAPEGGTP